MLHGKQITDSRANEKEVPLIMLESRVLSSTCPESKSRAHHVSLGSQSSQAMCSLFRNGAGCRCDMQEVTNQNHCQQYWCRMNTIK
eukprot:1160814-Pelagomonas_calceolata.AAC.6